MLSQSEYMADDSTGRCWASISKRVLPDDRGTMQMSGKDMLSKGTRRRQANSRLVRDVVGDVDADCCMTWRVGTGRGGTNDVETLQRMVRL